MDKIAWNNVIEPSTEDRILKIPTRGKTLDRDIEIKIKGISTEKLTIKPDENNQIFNPENIFYSSVAVEGTGSAAKRGSLSSRPLYNESEYIEENGDFSNLENYLYVNTGMFSNTKIELKKLFPNETLDFSINFSGITNFKDVDHLPLVSSFGGFLKDKRWFDTFTILEKESLSKVVVNGLLKELKVFSTLKTNGVKNINLETPFSNLYNVYGNGFVTIGGDDVEHKKTLTRLAINPGSTLTELELYGGSQISQLHSGTGVSARVIIKDPDSENSIALSSLVLPYPQRIGDFSIDGEIDNLHGGGYITIRNNSTFFCLNLFDSAKINKINLSHGSEIQSIVLDDSALRNITAKSSDSNYYSTIAHINLEDLGSVIYDVYGKGKIILGLSNEPVASTKFLNELVINPWMTLNLIHSYSGSLIGDILNEGTIFNINNLSGIEKIENLSAIEEIINNSQINKIDNGSYINLIYGQAEAIINEINLRENSKINYLHGYGTFCVGRLKDPTTGIAPIGSVKGYSQKTTTASGKVLGVILFFQKIKKFE